mgnify:CR=1 FL=1
MKRRNFLGSGLAAATVASTVGSRQASAAPKSPLIQLPGNPNAPIALSEPFSRSALIVGGGLAGLSAALELAERGYAVTLREKGDVLGGRLATPRLHTSQGEFAVEHGLHMWFDNYHNFTDIRERLGINKYFRPYNEVFTLYRDYKPEVLKSQPAIYPLNLLAMLERSPNMNMFSALRQLKMMPQVMAYNHDKIYEQLDDTKFSDWAPANVSNAFYECFLKPAAGVTLNDPEKVSAAEMVHFMHYYFLGQPKAMRREVTTVDHATAVLDPWRDRLLELGAKIETGRGVPGLRFKGGCALGEINSNEEFDHVIMALDVPGLKTVMNGSQALDAASADRLEVLKGRAAQLKVAPPYKVMRMWFDRRPNDSRWDIIETPQHHPINLLAQFHLMETESANWAKKTGGAIIEAHLYADWKWDNTPDEQVWPSIRDTFLEILPEMQNAQMLDYTVGSYHNFTSFETGQGLIRPTSDFAKKQGIANLGLAGDWVHTEYPSALMERAVSTGREAANYCLYEDGIRAARITMTSKHGPGLL